MHTVLALVPALALAFGLATPAFAQQWKPDVKFIKIGVSSAGGDWFRGGAKLSTMIPRSCPGCRQAPCWAGVWST
jgi:hypothetical protein